MLALVVAPTTMALRFPSADDIFKQETDDSHRENDSQNATDDPDERDRETLGQNDGDEFDEEGKRREVPVPRGDLIKDILPQAIRLFLYAGGVLLFISFSYAGVRLIVSRGNEDDFNKAKDMIIHVLIGLGIVGAAFAFVSGIIRALSNL